MLYIAIGILGATVMPHNLYLHSSIVQTRKYADTIDGKREAIRFASIDSAVALMFALFINAAILIMAAATFHGTGHQDVAEIGDAYQLLSPLLGTTLASVLFAVALLCSGQNATLTGHAGRPDRDGGLHQPAAAPVAAAADHPPHRDRPGHHRDRDLRRTRHRPADHPQPGGAEPAAALRGVSAGDVHQRPAQDGSVREPALGASSWPGRLRLSSRH